MGILSHLVDLLFGTESPSPSPTQQMSASPEPGEQDVADQVTVGPSEDFAAAGNVSSSVGSATGENQQEQAPSLIATVADRDDFQNSAEPKQAAPVQPIVDGNLYLTAGRGGGRDNVVQQLARLRGKYPHCFLRDVPDEELLESFLDIFFPEGCPASLFVCNIGLQQETPLLLVRPAEISPRMAEVLPPGLSIALYGKLFDNLVEPDNPLLLISRVVEIRHCNEPRPFERKILVRTYHGQGDGIPRRQRRENCLTSAFVNQLPLVGAQTRRRLDQWRKYLAFRERLVRASARGLRYVQVEFDAPDRVRFLVVAETSESLEQLSRFLHRRDAAAFPLSASEDPWSFRPAEGTRKRLRPVPLAEKIGHPTPAYLTEPPGCPWPEPAAAWLTWRLSEEHQNRYEELCVEADEEHAAQWVINQFHEQGFIGVSLTGDLVLIARQLGAIRTLEQEGGFAPMLSSYLFDISRARVPARLEEIPAEQWATAKLNEDQKRAVQVMLSAPDVALVQGPPGTGKTTVIAEAVYQMVRRGQRVLVASQANLAVENALERLPMDPAIRAVALGLRGAEEHRYSPRKALGTYYASIAQHCRRETLDLWETLERESHRLEKWQSELKVLEGDLRRNTEQLEKAQQRIGSLANELQSCRQTLAKRQRIQGELAAVQQLRGWLQHPQRASLPEELPEQAAECLYEQLVYPCCQVIQQAGLGGPTAPPRHASKSIVLYVARQLAETAAGLPAFLQRVESDFQWVKQQSVQTPQTQELQRQLKELRQRRDELAEQVAVDASSLQEFEKVNRQIDEIEQRLRLPIDVSEYRQFVKDCSALLAHRTSPQRLAASLEDLARQLKRVLDSFHEGCAAASKSLSQCEAELASLLKGEVPQPQQIQLQLRKQEHQRDRLHEQRQHLAERLRQLLQQVAEHFQCSGQMSPESARALLQQRIEQIAERQEATRSFREDWSDFLVWWTRQLTDPQRLKTEFSHSQQRFIESCNVVGVTCTESNWTLENASQRYFDTVIIDEVSKATPPELLIPMLRGQTVVLVGDHRQLPPLFPESAMSWEEVMEELEQGNRGDSEDTTTIPISHSEWKQLRKIVTATLFQELFEKAPEPLRATLTVQYRMHPQIMDLINLFYDHQLQCGLQDPDGKLPDSPSEMHRLHGLRLVGPHQRAYLEPQQHALWVDSDTTPDNEAFFESQAGTSKVNLLEAALIAQVLCDIAEEAPRRGYSRRAPLRVGIVSFYGRQIREIRTLIRRVARDRGVKLDAVRYDVNTVDRYQGRERPIVLVSLVRRPRKGRLSSKALTAQFQRVNVALSRAQSLLIVFGAVSVFRKYDISLPYMAHAGTRRVPVYRHMIDHIARLGGLRSAADILTTEQFRRYCGGLEPSRARG